MITYPLVLMSHLFLAPFNTASGTTSLFLILGYKFFFGKGVKALERQKCFTRLQRPKKSIITKNLFLIISVQTLTRAWTRSWCLFSKVARSTCPSSVGLRVMSSGWIFSRRALTSHSCLCFALRYGFASRPSMFGSPAPVNAN